MEVKYFGTEGVPVRLKSCFVDENVRKGILKLPKITRKLAPLPLVDQSTYQYYSNQGHSLYNQIKFDDWAAAAAAA